MSVLIRNSTAAAGMPAFIRNDCAAIKMNRGLYKRRLEYKASFLYQGKRKEGKLWSTDLKKSMDAL